MTERFIDVPTHPMLAERLRAETPSFINNPGVVALITHVGPFNYREWAEISQDPERATHIALELFKEFSLLVEGARPGAGREFQHYVLTAPPEEIDLPALMQAEDLRTRKDLKITYVRIPFMQDVSAYLTSGRNYWGMDCAPERDFADFFPAVIDLGHFSRIMQKDIAGDDVKRIFVANEVGVQLERNLNATFTHREGVHTMRDLWPALPSTVPEGRIRTIEQSADGQTLSIANERQNQPNVSFTLSITKPEAFKPIVVRVSEGRGEVREQQITTSDELLRYLSAQFESLLPVYPLEKASLIFDKFVYKLGIGDAGIQMAVVQRVKDEDGKQKAKVMTVGTPTVIIIREEIGNNQTKNELAAQMRVDTEDAVLKSVANKIGVPENEIPQGELTTRQKNRLIAKARGLVNTSIARVEQFITHPEDIDVALGALAQAPHRMVEIELSDNESIILIPPSIARKVDEESFIREVFLGTQGVLGVLAQRKDADKNMAMYATRTNSEGIQVIKNEPWTEEIVLSQLTEYMDVIRGLQTEFKDVFVSMQFAHFHPTAPRHTPIQEQAADIARILGTELRGMGVTVEGRSLADEYHTSDRMANWQDFYDMLQTRAGDFFHEFIQESSPEMRMIGDAQVRAMLMFDETIMKGGTLRHMMPDGKILELWDGAQDTDGRPVLGRQACVPFNTGMDVVLMAPDTAHAIYNDYVQMRFSDSLFARMSRKNPGMTIHNLIAEIMKEPDITTRNERRLSAINEIERDSYAEVAEARPDITAFDLYFLDELYAKIRRDFVTGERVPVVTHILEGNYNAQQGKAGYMWEQVGIPGVPIFRISFNPESKKISLLRSNPPTQDYVSQLLEQNREAIETVRQQVEEFKRAQASQV